MHYICLVTSPPPPLGTLVSWPARQLTLHDPFFSASEVCNMLFILDNPIYFPVCNFPSPLEQPTAIRSYSRKHWWPTHSCSLGFSRLGFMKPLPTSYLLPIESASMFALSALDLQPPPRPHDRIKGASMLHWTFNHLQVLVTLSKEPQCCFLHWTFSCLRVLGPY